MADGTNGIQGPKTAKLIPPTELDETGQRLVAAALEVFEERGYQRAGVQAIARRAGLTTGAIYSRFRGKDELLQLALQGSLKPEEVFADPRAVDITSILSLLGESVLEHGEPAGIASRVMLEAAAQSGHDETVAGIVHGFMDAEREVLADVIEKAKADGLFDLSLDTDATVKLCQSIGLGFMMFRALGVDMPDPKAWEHVIATLISAAVPPMSSTEE